MNRDKLKAIDIFSGCGGLTHGLKSAGFNVVCSIELNEFAASNYSLNHPESEVFIRDVSTISPEEVLEKAGVGAGEIDLVAGCPPCQGFSTMRTRNGNKRILDKRNTLIDDFLRIIVGLSPKVVLLENVPKLQSYTRYKDFKRVLRRSGYHVTDRVVDIADYGVPQRRNRLVLLASKFQELPIPDKCSISQSVRETIGYLPRPEASNDPLHQCLENRSKRVRDLIAAIPKNGGSRRDLPEDFVLECHKRTNGFKDVYGRMRWDDVAPTITTGCVNPSKGRFLHPEQNRAITLREAALLQTFPLDYRFDLNRGKYAVAELIGNALPPKFAFSQAAAIVEHLQANMLQA